MALYETLDEEWERDRDQFEAVLPDVLDGEEDGLTPVEIKKRVEAHPDFEGEIDTFHKSIYLLRASDDIVIRYWRDVIRFIAPEYEDRPELDDLGRPK